MWVPYCGCLACGCFLTAGEGIGGWKEGVEGFRLPVRAAGRGDVCKPSHTARGLLAELPRDGASKELRIWGERGLVWPGISARAGRGGTNAHGWRAGKATVREPVATRLLAKGKEDPGSPRARRKGPTGDGIKVEIPDPCARG